MLLSQTVTARLKKMTSILYQVPPPIHSSDDLSPQSVSIPPLSFLLPQFLLVIPDYMKIIMQLNVLKPKLIFHLTIYLLCLILSFNYSLCSGADANAISGNQSISGDQTLISKGGNFELGFFRPGNSSNFFYIGIWYKKINEKTIVWVANRETPVKDKYSSSLRIRDRNLVLLDESQEPVWSTNVDVTTSGPVMAVLRDGGNFVLTQASSNSSNATSISPIWQSFDNPTDTWLPGAKLSYNKVTKKPQSLASWKNSENPAAGYFSLEFDINANQYITKWNSTHQYWASGTWNEKSKDFSLVPALRFTNYNVFNISYADNANETYFTYNIVDPDIVSRIVLDVSGQIKQFTWLDSTKQWGTVWTQPEQHCRVYDYCGEFGVCNENSLPFCYCLEGFEPKSDEDWNLNDYSGGCQRKIDLQCEDNGTAKGENDKFRMYPELSLLEHSQSVTVGSATECESICLSNCSCTAYVYDNNRCQIWNQKLLNLQQLSADGNIGRRTYIRLSASEFSSAKNTSTIVIAAVVGSVVVLVLLGAILFAVWRRRRRMVGAGKAAEDSLVVFGYRDLQNATKKFSEKLGVGGFGSVFKGRLPDSSIIAVKKLESISQGEKQFRSEVSTIGTIQHVNLVRLRGFCSEGSKKLLVYEYLENRSLDSHLFHGNESKVLNWKTRFQIALGIAKGLAYLHEKCREVIIHCDIKPENILLDAAFCPKIADFGLAKLMGHNFSRVLTTIRGTRGYLAPEWISGVAITTKADVYSFGMMLFELISGKRNSAGCSADGNGVLMFFPILAARVVIEEEGDILSLLDPKLDDMADVAEVLRLSKVAFWCIQDDETQRPSMGQVVQILEGALDVNLPPIPGALQAFLDSHEHVVCFTDSSIDQTSSESETKLSLLSMELSRVSEIKGSY